MVVSVYFWLAVSIVFEVVGDIAVKSATSRAASWAPAMLAYNLMLITWFLAVNAAGRITVPGTIWLACGQLALVAVGCGMFGEQLSLQQAVGVCFALASFILLNI